MRFRTRILLSIFIMLWIQLIASVGIVHVRGDSMNNTLEDGDYYLYNKKNYTHINRFDIVVVDSEVLDERIIKRVIGLPGETVAMIGNILYIDGEKVEQNFDFIDSPEDFSVTLEEDEYYVMGDNRPVSLDSRDIGPVSENEIKDVVIM